MVTAIAIAALVIFIGCAIAVTLNNRQNSNKVSTSEPVSMAEKKHFIYTGLSLRERNGEKEKWK